MEPEKLEIEKRFPDMCNKFLKGRIELTEKYFGEGLAEFESGYLEALGDMKINFNNFLEEDIVICPYCKLGVITQKTVYKSDRPIRANKVDCIMDYY